MINTKTSGKLYIAGEYQVLNSGGLAIVYGLDKYIEFNIESSNNYSYQNGDNIKHSFTYNDDILEFDNSNDNEIVKQAFEVVFKFLELKKVSITPFSILINSELETTKGEKYGFGSSSAIISGLIKVVAKFFGLELSNDTLFKLSVIAQKEANELTSGGDLAAAIYGTTLLYQRYNLKWFLKQKNFSKLLKKKWPKLKIQTFKTNLKFGAIWTKFSYKTKNVELNITKKQFKEAKRIVSSMYVNIIQNNYLEVKSNFKEYQKWLDSVLFDEQLITNEIKLALKILNKFYLKGKVSGAGGGDSVIFLYPNNYDFTELQKELELNNLELILL